MFTLSATTLLLFTPVAAQVVGGGSETLFQWNGGAIGDAFGCSVAGAGDVDQDGVADVIVGAYGASPGGLTMAGSAFVYSGANGALLHHWDGGAAGDFFGFSVSGIGDINNDSFDDLIIGAINAADSGGVSRVGSVYAYSGADGTQLHHWEGGLPEDSFGHSVSSAGDINMDGIADVIVGANGTDPGGRNRAGSAYVYSGADGNLLFQWDGTGEFDELGYSVSGVGDVNADGVPDLIVGAHQRRLGGWVQVGSAYVFSGADGSLIYQWDGGAQGDAFGRSVSEAGDVNADNVPDMIIGASWTDPGGRSLAGSAYVYSGADGSLLHQWDGLARDNYFGTSVSAAGDTNGDGFDDLVIGATGADPNGLSSAGSSYLYSGRDGSMLHRWDGSSTGSEFGFSIAGAGDIDGNGFPDVIVGARQTPPGSTWNTGSAYLLSFKPFLYSSAFEISASSGGIVSFVLDFPDSAGLYKYKILISETGTGPTTYGVEIPLTLDSLVNRTFFGNYPISNHNGLQGDLDSSGDAFGSLTVPAGISSLIGKTFFLAAIANPTGQLPEFSSIASTVLITP